MKQFLQWLICLEASVLTAVIIMYVTNGLGMGNLGRDFGFLGSMVLIFQIPMVCLAATAKGTPWPFRDR